MKKILCSVLLLVISINFTACNMWEGEDKVKIIKREKVEERQVVEIDFLQEGSLCDVAPDGEKILFCRNDSVNTDNYLYAMDLTNKECLQIFNVEGFSGYNAKYAPDGQKISVSALNRDNRSYLLRFILDMNNSRINRIYCSKKSEIFEYSEINWSLDGNYIAVLGWNSKNDQISIFNSEGKEVSCINKKQVYDIKPLRMPFNDLAVVFLDESRVIYNLGESIVFKNIKDENEVPNNIVQGSVFAVSPNRKYIAYVTESDTDKFHVKVDLLGADMTVLYTTSEFYIQSSAPVFNWSPDNKNITYYSDNSIWNLNIETKAVTQLTNNMGMVKKIFWADNNSFIFETLNDMKSMIYQVKFKNYDKLNKRVENQLDIKVLNEQLKKLKSEAISKHSEGLSGIRASSTLMGNYSVQNLTDKNLSSAWVEGQSGFGEGQYVEFELKDIALNRVGIVNGYKKGEYLYTANSKVKTVKIEVETFLKNLDTGEVNRSECKEKIVELPNRGYYDENIDLIFHYSDFEPVAKNQVRLAKRIRLTILEAYKGNKYDDTCISEVIIIGK